MQPPMFHLLCWPAPQVEDDAPIGPIPESLEVVPEGDGDMERERGQGCGLVG